MSGIPTTGPLFSSPWWQTAAGITRPPLKAAGRTLGDLIDELVELKDLGFDGLEVFAPSLGGDAYGGLDVLDFYQIDPAIGTNEDFERLVTAAHARGIAVVPFLNLGYVHEEYPAFLRACDDRARGLDTADTRMFIWSADATATIDFPVDDHFLQGSHGSWEWSERAQSFYWVKWDGDKGDRALPQLNWADEGWRREAARVMDFWLATGADGIVVDAVNWYIGADWQSVRDCITERTSSPGVFMHPEGGGGFADDPTTWITSGKFSLVMDYGLKIWWDDIDVVRDAVLTGEFDALESALASFRDPVDAAGGTCFINPPRMSSHAPELQRLASLLVGTVGELYFDAFGISTMSSAQKEIAREVLQLRKQYPALTAAGVRVAVDSGIPGVYAFVRGSGPDRVLVAVNFSTALHAVRVSIDGVATTVSVRARDVAVLSVA